jgi:hypothetical protein
MPRIKFALVLLAGIAFLVSGCGGGTSVSNSGGAPNIISLSPSSVPAGSGSFSLSITGKGLFLTSVVHFGNDALPPISVVAPQCVAPGSSGCDEHLQVAIPSTDVSSAGAINISVSNGPLVSNGLTFTVASPIPAPTGAPAVISFSPMAAPAGGPSFPLTIAALNVASGASVNFGSLTLSPTEPAPCLSASLCVLQVQIPASAIATSQALPLSITNPGSSGGTSAGSNFLVFSASQFPIEESVSNADPPAPANAASTNSSVSAGGAFVVFDSVATNLDPKATSGLSQVYERTNCFAATANCKPQTTLISVAPDGSPGAGGAQGSLQPVISLDGRFVVFESDDTNLVSGVSQPVEQIYLRDTCNSIFGAVLSCTPLTTLVTRGADGNPGNAPSTNPTISAFGLFVAYQSAATNLTTANVPASVQQIYLVQDCPELFLPGLSPTNNPLPGCTPQTTIASLDASGLPGDKDSITPSLDPIGLSLSFASLADNIVPNTPGNGFKQVYLRSSLCLNLPLPISSGGAPPCGLASTVAISVDSQGNLGTGGDSITPSTGAAGLLVAFASSASNIVSSATPHSQIFVRSNCSGFLHVPACTPQTQTIPVANSGTISQLVPSSNPAISFGNRVAFGAVLGPPSNLPDQLVVGAANVCLPSLLAAANPPCSSSPVLVSSGANGSPTGGSNASMDGSGSFITFSGMPTNSALGTTQEIFLAAPLF